MIFFVGRVISLSSIAHQWSYRDFTWTKMFPSRSNYGSGTIAYGQGHPNYKDHYLVVHNLCHIKHLINPRSKVTPIEEIQS